MNTLDTLKAELEERDNHIEDLRDEILRLRNDKCVLAGELNRLRADTDTIEELKARLEDLKSDFASAKYHFQQRHDEDYRHSSQLTAELKVTRRLLTEANNRVEDERKRIIAASDAAFRYISKRR